MSAWSVLVLFPDTHKRRNSDQHWPYRQDSNFYYLTNDPNMHSHFVLLRSGGETEERIFTKLEDPQFEVWVGKLPTVEDLQARTGVERVLPVEQFEGFIDSLLFGVVADPGRKYRYDVPEHEAFYRQLEAGNVEFWLDLGRNRRQDDDGASITAREFAGKLRAEFPEVKIRNISAHIETMREVKSESELEVMQRAIDITGEAHLAAMQIVQTGTWEYEVQARVDETFRKLGGCCWSYESISGAGENATILHYTANDAELKQGDLFLLDAGAEYGHYASDVTRTFPISGEFSADQQTIYELVLKSQREAIRQSAPGMNMKRLNRIAQDVIAEGLVELGLMTEPTTEQVESYFLHGLGHAVGLDVHDAYAYHRDFVVGNVFTVEPGIYVRPQDVTEKDWYKALDDEARAGVDAALERYGGIGVRIEDQILITDGEPVIMSAKIPVTVDEIETVMAELVGRGR
jgi:Xaa-Pro aminopeptidase